ncbi:antiviral reverse transcriptase Drt3b [Bradyrhizobium sp. S3.2.12]|uniref:antiviral reverse transcriptase Drt3b n=1 Tax=Bradyrhizobium sp. S3.2.12 TaxID=3156387 RepID=UPI003399159B
MASSGMRRGNIDRSNSDRAVLTDTAPMDVPIVFSNDGFHTNLRRTPATPGLKRVVESLITSNSEHYTVPYRYRIRLSTTASRQLSLAHPAAQKEACGFYQKYGHLLPYFCRHAEVSLRRAAKVGSSVFYLTRTAESKRYKGAAIDMLLHDESVRNPGSYFAYAGYDRFYKFFNSQEFLGLEKTFSMMRLTDVSKCFSSIYSHTLAWAVKDIQHGKEHPLAVSFANEFDSLMQYANYNETNGIPVGAEASRIFAEIILQSVDVAVLKRAKRAGLVHGSDFAIRRYIDDYAIFANTTETLDVIQRAVSDGLLMFNLHLNEAKTHTIARPLQTRRSQIISGASPALHKFRESISEIDESSRLHRPRRVREPESVVRTFVNDIKVASTNGGAGYEDVSPYIIGSIGSTLEILIAGFPSAPAEVRKDAELYAKAFDTLLSALFYFFTVHATVTASYQVAKATILSVRFFKDNFTAAAEHIFERVRTLIQEVITNPSLLSVAMTECVPIEMLNIILASTALPEAYKTNVHDIRRRVIDDENADYFSIVSLLFYFGQSDPDFINEVENKLCKQFLPKAMPRKISQDAHLLLDLIACPFLSKPFKRECAHVLLKGLEISTAHYSNVLLAEIERFPWFVNWREIDLLNHLRKKELRAVY